MSCPDREQIEQLLAARLGDEQHARLVHHLDTCPACQALCQTITESWCSNGPLASVMASLSSGEAEPGGPHLERAMEQLQSRPAPDSAACAPVAEEGPCLDFLDPPRDPAHLGRLDGCEVLEVLGRGGMGIVLKAHDPELNRMVAIKVLSPAMASSANARCRFLREARAVAAISHEHVVAVHAVGEIRGLPFLVMEYVGGQSLQERLDSEGPMPLEDVLRISLQTALGLAAAHAQGLIHRDIKPANILLENGVERVKITDFGLARAVDDVHLTRTGVVAGTPEYMSPEQAAGRTLDARSDLFSLGGSMYAMCTGQPPFAANTVLEAIRRVAEDHPQPIRKIEPGVPKWLAAIIERLLAADPDARFQSASEVADLLARHLVQLQQPEDAARPARCPGDPRTRALRPRGWVILAAALLLLGGTLCVTEATGVTHVRAFVATLLRIRTRHETVDLLSLIDPQRDTVSPRWRWQDRTLLSSGDVALLQIPFEPPEEYDLQVEAERLAGVDCLAIGLVLGDRQATVEVDGYREASGNLTALNAIDGHYGLENETATPGTVLPLRRPACLTVLVRNSGVRVVSERKTLIDWQGDPSRLTLRSVWSPRHPSFLFLGSFKSTFKISRLELRPVSGKGRRLSFTQRDQADAHRMAAERALWAGGTVSAAVPETPPQHYGQIAELPSSFQLTAVSLRGSRQLTKADFGHLAALDNLQRLDLSNASFGDELLEAFPRMPGVTELDLSLTAISDAGLAGLPDRCPALHRLILSGTAISDAGVRPLVALRQLEFLDLTGTRVSDEGLKVLSELSGLERLLLDHTAVSDAGLAHLRDHPGLQYLSLIGTDVSDAALQHLELLDPLRGVCLLATRATPEGLHSLRQRRREVRSDGHLEQAVDLLSLIDPARDAILGSWQVEDGALITPKGYCCRLQIPYSPPDEYVMELVVARRSGDDALVIGIVAGERQAMVIVDQGWDRGAGLGYIDGQRPHETETARAIRIITGPEPLRILVTVRQSRITMACDDRVVVEWRGDFRRLSPSPLWSVPDSKALWVGSFRTSFAITKLQITPISGVGKVLNP